ncbi:MAG TPA: NAD(+) synthase [Chlamydiales bacterium]|nr:NAD(+) synthase [Chlamydiales bacterium]
MKVLAAQINPTIGDVQGNVQKILQSLDRARQKGANIILFPELTLSGYFPDDLLLDAEFINACHEALEQIAPATKGLFACIGLPRRNVEGREKFLYNSVAVFADGALLGFKNKTLLPTYDVFDERRYFEPGNEEPIWEYLGLRIAVTICEDVWQHASAVYRNNLKNREFDKEAALVFASGASDHCLWQGGEHTQKTAAKPTSSKTDSSGCFGIKETHYRIDPVLELKSKQPDLLLNLSGSPYYFHRKDERLSIFQAVARTLRCPVVLCNQVGANDQLIFDGHSLFLNGKGDLIQIAKGFEEDDLLIDLNANVSPCTAPENGVKDLYSALVLGVRDYLHKQKMKKAIIGLSGGIDSALVACIAQEALGKENVVCVGLPSRYSTPASITDAENLAKNLGVEFRLIPIDPIFQMYLDLLEPMFQGRPFDATEENLQSRIRSMVLMAFSNKEGLILLNTGNKSEMAMGYATLYGDMAGGLGVLHDVTKLRIYDLAKFVNRRKEIIPQSIIEKVPSAELKENQTDFETLPPYEILDPVIEDYIEEQLPASVIARNRNINLEFVKDIIYKIHHAEYKRRQAPIGLRVTKKAFSKGRHVPIVQKWKNPIIMV